MRVTIKYSMAVEEGMRRFFFPLLSLVSASGNQHVIRSRADSQPGGRSGGAGRGPSADPARALPEPARAQPEPGPSPARSAPPPGAALGRCRCPRARTGPAALSPWLPPPPPSAGTRAGCGGGRVLRGSATRSPAPREVIRAWHRLSPSGPAAVAPLAPGNGLPG